MNRSMLGVTSRGSEFGMVASDVNMTGQFKKRKISTEMEPRQNLISSGSHTFLPTLQCSDYFMEPSLKELTASEHIDPGYCGRVHDFTVGRFGYGCVKFLGQTDIRGLNIDQIVKFDRHVIVVYGDDMDEPVVGKGLNKTSIVTLILKVRPESLKGKVLNSFVKKLRSITERQGAQFISFNSLNGEWKFVVSHFSRFGLMEEDEDEDDIPMDEEAVLQNPEEMDDTDVSEGYDEELVQSSGAALSHSLPAHLGLDPIKMQEMRTSMFSAEEDEDFDVPFSQGKHSFFKESARPSLQHSALKMNQKNSPPAIRRTPQALIGYHSSNSDPSPPGSILMTSQNKGMPLKLTKVEGFKLDLKCETPITGSHSNNVVDAALFMGRSFRVGWGPNGILVHTGTPVGKAESGEGLSSVITMEKVGLDKVVRDENNNVKEELISSCFVSPLELHKLLNHETTTVKVGSFRLTLQKRISNCLALPEICRNYIGIIERQLDVTGLPISAHTRLMHQVMVWELIKVLFSEKDTSGHRKSDVAGEEEIMHDKDSLPEIDQEALPFVRRAEFSYWLQESVGHRVQDEISCLTGSNDLEHIFLLLTGRQLDAAVELAASRGDVRLGCLLSQAGGSMVNRADVARQLDLWRINDLDFNFMEKERIRLYELLSGNIQGALGEWKLDWKRYLGLLMWYQLPPNTSLSKIIQSYEQILIEGGAPYPVPVYIDEGPLEEETNWSVGDHFDMAYYLMLLHADKDKGLGVLKTMFSAFSSTNDALDYHMIWHQRAILEAVGTFTSNDLHVLDMSLVSQLLCLGLCHWAIYVVLHMPYDEGFPFLHASLIREILFQYCEFWSTQEIQRQFIEELGVPLEWMHEAMAVYCNYNGDLLKALEHFLASCNWQRAHSIFMTSVAHSLYLSAKHSEVWRLATCMEDHKSEIADWDLGAGIYMSFYQLKTSLQDVGSTSNEISDSDSLQSSNAVCKEFFSRLNESLQVWGSRLPVDARVCYSKMAEEICCLLQSQLQSQGGDENEDGPGLGPSYDVGLGSYVTMVNAPLPEDLRSCHLQEAISHFTFFLSATSAPASI